MNEKKPNKHSYDKILKALDGIAKKNKQINFDSKAARKQIAGVITSEL